MQSASESCVLRALGVINKTMNTSGAEDGLAIKEDEDKSLGR